MSVSDEVEKQCIVLALLLCFFVGVVIGFWLGQTIQPGVYELNQTWLEYI
ncbi:MAG: hypothetical protein O0X96_05645 [Methanocorpusculum sp.]|nr:hypothetical protein [Methanocorpusculum sp.]MDE2524594.1 hypothetical protein [Methanocorpusculum sp.]